jgi:hypothetical protein
MIPDNVIPEERTGRKVAIFCKSQNGRISFLQEGEADGDKPSPSPLKGRVVHLVLLREKTPQQDFAPLWGKMLTEITNLLADFRPNNTTVCIYAFYFNQGKWDYAPCGEIADFTNRNQIIGILRDVDPELRKRPIGIATLDNKTTAIAAKLAATSSNLNKVHYLGIILDNKGYPECSEEKSQQIFASIVTLAGFYATPSKSNAKTAALKTFLQKLLQD